MEVKGKFIVAFDTICDGNQSAIDENNLPVLYDSHDEAYKELFSDAISGLEGTDEDYLDENGLSDLDAISTMKELLKEGDVQKMKEFLENTTGANYYGEFVEKAEDFVLGRKAVFTGKGIVIEGARLEDL